MMVRRLLPGCDRRRADAADALAVAICHAHHARRARAGLPGRARMIAKLAGVVDQIEPDDGACIDVDGVGYLVFCSTRTLGRLPPRGAPARLLIETHVREDHIHLYGFVDAAERDWFRLLTTVQGVGARLALAILSAVPPEKLGARDPGAGQGGAGAAEGVGPRLAARIVNELRDKIGGVAAPVPAPAAAPLDEPANGRRSGRRCGLGAGQSRRSAAAEALGAVAAAARRLGGEAGRRCADQRGPGGAGAMSDAAPRVVAAAAGRAGRSRELGPAADARRIRRPASAARQSARLHRGGAAAAARRSTMCCSSGRRGSARRRWRRSSPASWASASAPPPGR